MIATLMLIVSCSPVAGESIASEDDEADGDYGDAEEELDILEVAEDESETEEAIDTVVEVDSAKEQEEEEKEEEESTVKVIELSASNWEFTVTSADDIYEGDIVQMIVTGESGSHGLKFEDLDVSISSIRSGDVETVEFVAPVAGEYRYYCSIFCGSGHSTMDGVLTVLATE